jgi:hypothetical protein
MLESINLWAVIIAAASAFVLGGIWYSPVLFGSIWKHEAGVVIDETRTGHGAVVYILSFLLSLIAAAAFALLLGEEPDFKFAVGAGFITGLCWVATSFGINYLFASRSVKLFLIDAGYHTLQFTLYGAILGTWH